MIQRTLFNAEHEAFRDSFQRFIDKEIAPFHAEWEEQGYVDRAVWHKAGANGFLCMSLPEQYGGSGADKLYSVVQMEEISRTGFSGIGFSLHSEIVAPYLLHYGTPEQKEKYLPLLASGEMIGAIAMSEPAAARTCRASKPRPCCRRMAVMFLTAAKPSLPMAGTLIWCWWLPKPTRRRAPKAPVC